MKIRFDAGNILPSAMVLMVLVASSTSATAQVAERRYPYKNIAAVKCWMGSYDDDNNYTAGGCEGSSLRSASGVPTTTTVGSQLASCIGGGGTLLPVAGNDDVLACKPATARRRTLALMPGDQIAKALKMCLPKGMGVVSDGAGLVCVAP